MSATTSFERAAILGLCQQRVPLGVQARGLKISSDRVRATAREFLATGEIGELPADDIRNGHLFTWAEEMLPDASGADHIPSPSGVVCPCCGGATRVLSPNLIARACELPPQQEAILTRVWQGKGKPVTGETLVAAMYADDIDGGPEYETGRKYFKTQLCLLRKSIEGTGVRIEAVGYQRGFRLVLGEAAGQAPQPQSGQMQETGSANPILIVVAPEKIGSAEPELTTLSPAALDMSEATPPVERPRKKARKPRAPTSSPAKGKEKAAAPIAEKSPPAKLRTAAIGPKLRVRPARRASIRHPLVVREKRTNRFERWK